MEIALRLPKMSDALTILSWENNTDNWEVSGNNGPYSLGDIQRLIQSFEYTDSPKQLRFIIVFEDILIGAVDIFDINYENKSGAIGILIAEEKFRRKGFGAKALELMEIEARKLGVHRLTALIHSGNKKSLGLFEKMGYFKSSSASNDDNKKTIVVEKWVEKESSSS